MRSLLPQIQGPARRRGLAPLELVLSLPLLLMIMAMIIVVGTAGSWKVRTLANSRQAAARGLWPRDGAFDAKPASWWPDSAVMSSGAADPAPFDDDPFTQHAVVRGPVIGAQGSGLRVNTDMLDVTRGLAAGFSSINRDLPLWRQLPYRNQYQRETQVFSGDQWQFAPMGLGDNDERRVDNLYPDYSLGTYGGLARTIAAREALLSFAGTPPGQRLEILDNDPALNNRDFYPRLPWEICSTDLQPLVDSLKGQIDLVPCELARAYLQLYPQGTPEHDQLQQFIDQNCGGTGGTP
ncbi:MAG: hypothetical protein JNG89_12650 [Planctomycetaceae bacterium]|nr:hypothetical protein [Planctomycetaceae bacterium]